MSFSDYIVYVDESGDHGMASINPDYPVFVLSFCIFQKEEYRRNIMPAITALKFKFWGHDMVVLHEYDIRKRCGPFAAMNKILRDIFVGDLSQIMAAAKFEIVAVVFDKLELQQTYGPDTPGNPYNIGMKLGLERLFQFLQATGQEDLITPVIFESRGKKEDAELAREFRRVCAGENSCQSSLFLEITMANKMVNSTGLQFADMTARPIGLSYLRPAQSNRAFQLLESKFVKLQDAQNPIIHPQKT